MDEGTELEDFSEERRHRQDLIEKIQDQKITISSPRDSIDAFRSIDLKKCIEQYAWKKFRENKVCFRRLLVSKKKYYVDARWEFLQFKHKTTQFVERGETTLEVPNDQDKYLYNSNYNNKTSLTQHYTFSASRETKTSVNIQVQDNYTLAGSMNLEINIAEFVKLGAGFNPSLSVTKTSGETFEKTLRWNVNSEVMVKPWYKAEATLCVYEESKVYDFEVETTVSLKEGKLPVAIRRKKDDEFKSVLLFSLPNVFQDKYKRIEVIGDTIQLTTKGVCQIVSWTNQHVNVESEEMPDMPEHIKRDVNKTNETD